MLRKRDRQSVSSTASQKGRPPWRGGPQGPPPSTFLFLPIRLSNSAFFTAKARAFPAKRLRPDKSAGWLFAVIRRRSDTVRRLVAAPPSMGGLYEALTSVSTAIQKIFAKSSPRLRTRGFLKRKRGASPRATPYLGHNAKASSWSRRAQIGASETRGDDASSQKEGHVVRPVGYSPSALNSFPRGKTRIAGRAPTHEDRIATAV